LSNLLKRSITGTIYLTLLIGSILLGKYTFSALFLAINVLALFEFFNIIANNKFFPNKYLGIAIGSALFILAFVISSKMSNSRFYIFLIPLLILLFCAEIYRNKHYPFVNIAITILGIVYISIPLSFLNYFVFPEIQQHKYTYEILLGYFILIWTNDTSAYIFGMTLGKHKLFKRVSPEKTWEGFIGGAVVTIIVACILPGAFNILNRIDFIVLGFIVSIFGVAGDLAESLLKRSINLKDTGKILPGHGGILDRIDSVLLTSPLIFGYLLVFK